MKGTNKKRVVKVVLPMLALALNSCYFNSSGHIFDAASHNAAVRPSDAKAGHKLWYDGHSYYTYLPRYRYDEKVVTQYSVGGVDDSDGKKHLTLTDDKQFVKLSPSLADYMLGKSQDCSGCAYPADADIADTCSTGYSVTQSVTDDRLCEFKYTSGAAPLWYTLGALNVVCVDIPVTCVENIFAIPCALLMATPGDVSVCSEFHQACAQGNYNQVKSFLEKGISPNITTIFNADSPLIIATKNGHADICRLLLSSGARVGARTAKREHYTDIDKVDDLTYATALHYAAYYGHGECVAVLCEYGADVGSINQLKRTPVLIAEERGNTAAALALRSYGAECYNYNATESYYRKLADAGDVNASALMGVHCYEKKEYETAFRYLSRGVETGNKDAIFCLGLSYYYGYGVFPNSISAEKWLKKSAEMGEKKAIKLLASLTANDGHRICDECNGRGSWTTNVITGPGLFDFKTVYESCRKCSGGKLYWNGVFYGKYYGKK